ncbi:histidine phosphatase family protein [Microbacterium resistens]|uniref:histidine phosphatase family protein n=1 Tax=Microbacterium resistens TaxID=156977 RepID=UPI0036702862
MIPQDRPVPHRLFLARHGQTAWNREGRLQGQLDSPLTSDGVAHAREIARRVRGRGIRTICSSPLGRAVRTAEIIAEILEAEVVLVPGLAEVHHGTLAGRTWAEIEAELPGTRAERADNRYGWAFPGGESYAQARGRVRQALEQCTELADGVPLLISHEMIGRMLRGEMRGLSPHASLDLRHPHGVVFELTHEAERVL